MILYHGSNEVFEEFKISKELAHHDVESILPEGIGVYMTSKKEIAKSYGELYTVEIQAKNILDFTTFKSCKRIINNFLKVYDTEKLLINIDDTINSIIDDRVQIIEMIKDIVLWNEEEVYNTISSDFDFYNYEEKITKNWTNYINQYCLKYNSNDLGIVYIAKNTEILTLIK